MAVQASGGKCYRQEHGKWGALTKNVKISWVLGQPVKGLGLTLETGGQKLAQSDAGELAGAAQGIPAARDLEPRLILGSFALV